MYNSYAKEMLLIISELNCIQCVILFWHGSLIDDRDYFMKLPTLF